MSENMGSKFRAGLAVALAARKNPKTPKEARTHERLIQLKNLLEPA